MNTIISKRHWLKFYVGLLVIASCILLIALAVFAVRAQSKTPSGEVILCIMSALLILFAPLVIVIYFINVPNLTITGECIKFNRKTYHWGDLKEIKFTGKRYFKYSFGKPREAATLMFSDGVKHYIFDGLYQNSAEIKLFIQQVIVDRGTYQPIEITKADTYGEEFRYYKGSPIFSFRGIMLWGFIIFIVSLIMKDAPYDTSASRLPLIVLCIGWFFFNSVSMYYIGVSENVLSIKNHHFFWFESNIYLKDITEVVFETYGKLPNCIRIITNDMSSKVVYKAGTLSDSKWLDLKSDLESRGVMVRNECI